MKSSYNERFSFANPLAKASACRVTRHRAKKLKEDHNAAAGSNPQYQHSELDPLMASYEVVGGEVEDEIVAVPFATATENSPSSSDVSTNLNTNTSIDYDVCDDVCKELDLMNYPQSLEVSDLVAPDTDNHIEEDDEGDDDEVANDVTKVQHEVLYKEASITTSASSVLLMKYAMKHKLSMEALTDLLQIVKLHCPSPNNIPSSLFHFKKQFKDFQYPINYHYFCNVCLSEVPKDVELCSNQACSYSFTEANSLSSFIELPVGLQLKSILERDEIYHIINERYHLRRHEDDIYTDVYSGKLYQHQVASGFLINRNNISFTLNTDGVPVFKSSKFSFWPIYLIINELPFHMRIAKENRILAALWYGTVKPDMGLFMKPVVHTLKELYDEGIPIVLPDRSFICHAVLICTTCDLPARAMILNMVNFNGFYSCCFCMQPGETHHLGERSHTHIYKYMEENPTGPKRNFSETLEQMKTAVSSNSTVYGFKGPSWLCCIPDYNFIKGMSVDYMHCILLGVTRLLLRLWMQSTYRQEMWYIGNQISIVDSRLCNIKPPDEIQRTPRSIELTVKFWKAHELRAWLLHYSTAVLYGILPEDYYQHHLLLVEATYLLLQQCIPEKDIQQSFELLKHYCFLFAALYGDQHMTINIHNLLHLPKVVKALGPLWAHSCFPFECANGELLNLFHGSQAVEKQVIRQISEHHRLPSYAKNNLETGSQQESLFKKMSYSVRKGHIICNNNSLTGKMYHGSLSRKEISCLQKINDTSSTDFVFYPHICLPNNNVISSRTKSKVTKRNNSCLMYIDTDGHFQRGICEKLFILKDQPEQQFCLITKLMSASSQPCKDVITKAQLHNHLVACNPPSTAEQEIISCDSILQKCIIMDLSSELGLVFISQLPNSSETD